VSLFISPRYSELHASVPPAPCVLRPSPVSLYSRGLDGLPILLCSTPLCHYSRVLVLSPSTRGLDGLPEAYNSTTSSSSSYSNLKVDTGHHSWSPHPHVCPRCDIVNARQEAFWSQRPSDLPTLSFTSPSGATAPSVEPFFFSSRFSPQRLPHCDATSWKPRHQAATFLLLRPTLIYYAMAIESRLGTIYSLLPTRLPPNLFSFYILGGDLPCRHGAAALFLVSLAQHTGVSSGSSTGEGFVTISSVSFGLFTLDGYNCKQNSNMDSTFCHHQTQGAGVRVQGLGFRVW
jgi:hypothetical protein